MKNNNHLMFSVTIASIGAGMMALYPLSHVTGILGVIIFATILVVEVIG